MSSQHGLGDHISLLFESHQRVTGKTLGGEAWKGLNGEQLVEAFHRAPCVIASHGTEEDPVFNYGNPTAIELWETDWETFVQMPSRYTAEAMEREERERLLHEVTTNGFISDYSGIRISTTGRRFLIKDATVWNVLDKSELYCGQAVVFSHWESLD